MGEGAITSHPPCSGKMPLPPSHGRAAELLRPPWASCMPATAPCAFTNRTMRANASRCWSFHSPVQYGVMRPRGSTLVASANTMPAPPTARDARFCKCQSSGSPSVAEYWHIGETVMRLRAVMERNVMGRKRCGTVLSVPVGAEEDLVSIRFQLVTTDGWRLAAYSALMPAPLMSGHHLSSSDLW